MRSARGNPVLFIFHFFLGELASFARDLFFLCSDATLGLQRTQYDRGAALGDELASVCDAKLVLQRRGARL